MALRKVTAIKKDSPKAKPPGNAIIETATLIARTVLSRIRRKDSPNYAISHSTEVSRGLELGFTYAERCPGQVAWFHLSVQRWLDFFSLASHC